MRAIGVSASALGRAWRRRVVGSASVRRPAAAYRCCSGAAGPAEVSEKLTRAQLVDLCRERGLPHSGKRKSALVALLTRPADAAAEEGAPEAPRREAQWSGGVVQYAVAIYMGDMRGAGTNARAFVELHGTNGTHRHEIDNQWGELTRQDVLLTQVTEPSTPPSPAPRRHAALRAACCDARRFRVLPGSAAREPGPRRLTTAPACCGLLLSSPPLCPTSPCCPQRAC